MTTKPLLLAATVLALAADVHAQAIFGTVRTVGGVPIEGVLIRGTRTSPIQRVSTSTDSSGGYVLGAGLSGTYTVEAIETTYTFTPATTNVTVSGSSVMVNFTSPSTVPVAATADATNVTATGATLLGSVNPNGGATTAWFEYGLMVGYGSVSGSFNAGSGTGLVSVNLAVAGLLNATNYHFRVVGSNSHGIRTGSDATFTTLSGLPTVTTLDPSDPGATSMRLNGLANPNGANATAWFEVGTTTNYGLPSVVQNVGNGSAPTNFNQMLVGLAAGTTYHYRAVVTTVFGTNHGADEIFTPGFSDGSAGVPGIYRGSVGWGDYDNDGRMDILLTGTTDGVSSVALAQVWRNTGNGFVNLNAGLPGVSASAAAWGDYDNDGRLDILLTGLTTNGIVTQVWRNTGSGFVLNTNAMLPGVYFGSVAWGDYNNDGRLDILMAGCTGVAGIVQVWRNTGGGFVLNTNAVLPGIYRGSVGWGDYDNDGRLDILLAGYSGSTGIAQVWRNTDSGFVNINAGLPGVYDGSVAWGDYDNDGRLDILLTGYTGFFSPPIAQVWRNTGNGFANINAGLPGVYYSFVVWGDYDHDGRLDLLLSGYSSSRIAQLWRNTGSGFVNINAGLPGVTEGSVAWGDHDNDGRLDILVAGATGSGGPSTHVWRNNLPVINTAPTAPAGLNLAVSNATAALTWNPAADNETPAAGLTYNLRIGTAPGGSDVLAPMSAANGLRRLPQFGNAQLGLSARLDQFAMGITYYWSVQAVDNAFAGSPFAPEQSFKFLPTSVPPAATSIVPGDLNGDGLVDQSELNTVLANYWPNSPFLQMTNVAGLGGSNVTFALTNSIAEAFSVESSTNLFDWLFLGPATPRYEFTDTNAPAEPQRFYRLRWP